jgi:hypothetical protein
MLHVPLEALTSRPVGDLSSWLQFDVLQTIVAGSLLCLAIAIAARSVTKARIVYSLLALATIASAPYVMKMQVDTTMPIIVRVVIDRTISPFPPVPWAFYVVAGAAFAGWIIPRMQIPSLWVWLTASGALTSAATMLRYTYGPTLPWDEHWWQGSPDLFLFRLGGIIAVLGLMMRIDRTSAPGPGLSFLHVMGSESLFMYISHLMIVYGATGTWLITTLGLGHSGYGMIALVWVAVTAPLAALAYGWRWIRKHHPHWAFRITAAHVASMIIWLLWVVLT